MGTRVFVIKRLIMTKPIDQLKNLDRNHYLHPFTDHHLLSKKGTRIITKGEGIYIWDAEGNKFGCNVRVMVCECRLWQNRID